MSNENNGNITMERAKILPPTYMKSGTLVFETRQEALDSSRYSPFITTASEVLDEDIRLGRVLILDTPRELILNRGQAEAVYTAMCHLNNVCGTIKCEFDASSALDFTRVFEQDNGSVRVCVVRQGNIYRCEDYATQSDFAAAYSV